MRVPATADNFRSSCLLQISFSVPTCPHPQPQDQEKHDLSNEGCDAATGQPATSKAPGFQIKHLKFCFSILWSKVQVDWCEGSCIGSIANRQTAVGVSIEKIDCETVTPLEALFIQAWQVDVKGDGKRHEVPRWSYKVFRAKYNKNMTVNQRMKRISCKCWNHSVEMLHFDFISYLEPSWRVTSCYMNAIDAIERLPGISASRARRQKMNANSGSMLRGTA